MFYINSNTDRLTVLHIVPNYKNACFPVKPSSVFLFISIELLTIFFPIRWIVGMLHNVGNYNNIDCGMFCQVQPLMI